MTTVRDTRTGPTSAQHTAGTAARPTAMLVALLVGQFMAVLDVSIVNVAAPVMRGDLHASGAGLQLIVSGYTVAYAVLLVGGARLGDRYGHGRAFRTGLAIFTTMSLLCGLAPTAALLILARVLQGAGAALMMPQVMSLIQRTYAGAERTRALSLYAAVIAGGAVAGQVIGGLLVSADLLGTGWRPVFLVNVPVGIVLLVTARIALPRDAGNPARRLDAPGTLLLAATVFLLVLPLVLGHELGWPVWCFVGLGASVVVFAGFVRVERRVERAGGSPILARRVLRAPGLLLGAGIVLLNMATYGGFLFATALHLQSGLGESPARVGLLFAPSAVGFAVAGLGWRRLPASWHGPMVPCGFAVAAAGYVGVAAVLAGGGTGGDGGWALTTLLGVVGLALGLAYSPVMGRALEHVPVADSADASGVLVTVIQLGQVLGVAGFGTLYLSLVDAPGARGSAHALTPTMLTVAAAVAVATALALRLVSRRRR